MVRRINDGYFRFTYVCRSQVQMLGFCQSNCTKWTGSVKDQGSMNLICTATLYSHMMQQHTCMHIQMINIHRSLVKQSQPWIEYVSPVCGTAALPFHTQERSGPHVRWEREWDTVWQCSQAPSCWWTLRQRQTWTCQCLAACRESTHHTMGKVRHHQLNLQRCKNQHC